VRHPSAAKRSIISIVSSTGWPQFELRMSSSMPASAYPRRRCTISAGGQITRFSPSSSRVWRRGSGLIIPPVTVPGPLKTLSKRL